jgi:hypothetical protein
MEREREWTLRWSEEREREIGGRVKRDTAKPD